MEFLDIIQRYSALLQVVGFCIGLLYLWWEYKADAKVWIASIIMPAINMWVYYFKGLYADFGINIYYLLIAVYGYLAWTLPHKKKTGRKSDAGLPVTHVRPRTAALLLVVFAALWVALAQFLINATDSNVPWADAFTTALSIVGLWMLARKYAEQWLVWCVVDAVCVWLYIYKGIYLYAGLYAIYTVIAMLGYRKWLRLIDKSAL